VNNLLNNKCIRETR